MGANRVEPESWCKKCHESLPYPEPPFECRGDHVCAHQGCRALVSLRAPTPFRPYMEVFKAHGPHLPLDANPKNRPTQDLRGNRHTETGEIGFPYSLGGTRKRLLDGLQEGNRGDFFAKGFRGCLSARRKIPLSKMRGKAPPKKFFCVDFSAKKNGPSSRFWKCSRLGGYLGTSSQLLHMSCLEKFCSGVCKKIGKTRDFGGDSCVTTYGQTRVCARLGIPKWVLKNLLAIFLDLPSSFRTPCACHAGTSFAVSRVQEKTAETLSGS